MKKVLVGLLLFFLGIMTPLAANYAIKELIPVGVSTSLHTSRYLYKDFSYQEEKESIVFSSIKNLTEDALPIQISIGLFDSKKKNIGTIFYCEDSLLGGRETPYEISVLPYLGEGKEKEEISYIAVLGDNSTCRKEGKDDYIGKKIEEIGYGKKNLLDEDSQLFVTILSIVGGVLLVLFFYRFLFTNRYENMNGKEVRKDYEKYQEEKVKEKQELEEEEKLKPVIMQSKEIAPKKEMKEEDDIRNLYS